MEPANRNFSTISPSAKALLLMKSLTGIPFAKEAADLVWTEEERTEKFQDRPGKSFFLRLVHFENRYWSVHTLMESTGIRNIMEISSGFSFRGLDKVLKEDVFYIDTDLEDVITTKKELLYQLLTDNGTDITGRLLTEALNVLDENEFQKLIDRFPPGPVCIVNEGLLMYLNMEEKKRLTKIIHKILQDRGGCWITADVYIKNNEEHKLQDDSRYGEQAARFLAFHNVEENKFESYEAAEQFFDEAGFRIDQINTIAFDKISSLQYAKNDSIEVTEEMVLKWAKNRQSWMLKVRD